MLVLLKRISFMALALASGFFIYSLLFLLEFPKIISGIFYFFKKH